MSFYDLVVEVAIVRPGPIQGDMVHPYLKRREDPSLIDYPKPELEPVLARTMGVPLFQEQAMQIAMVAAKFTGAEADQLRRSMATFKAKGLVSKFHEKLVKGMTDNGYEPEYAERIFKQLEGFGSYGFPESHATAFAHLVYVSSWMKCFYPDVFAAALLNSQPMGFYQPAEIVDDAKLHGVIVREVDVNHSYWDNTLEEKQGEYFVLRLGLKQIKGLNQTEMELLIANRGNGYSSVQQLSDAGISQAGIERLTDGDAFRSMGLDRRQALWQAAALADKPIALFAGQPDTVKQEGQIQLPFMTKAEHVVQDFATMGLSLKAHPVSFVRDKLDMLRVTPTGKLKELKDGDTLKVAGMITVRQHPGTAKGVLFITIKDETGFSNLVVWARVFEQYRKEILQARLLMVEGKVQIEGDVIHVVVSRCYNLNNLLQTLTVPALDMFPEVTMSRSDETTLPEPSRPEPKDIFYKGRNFR